jgi:acetyl-CoA synthetase
MKYLFSFIFTLLVNQYTWLLRDYMQEQQAPAWIPTQASITKTNISRALMNLQLADYPAFHRWSIHHYQEFWQYTIEQLGISFSEPPRSICDLTAGATKPNWLPHAKMNITESCFQAAPAKTAVIAKSAQGEISKMSYVELERFSKQIAAAIVRAGYKPGDAIGIIMPMTAMAVAAYLGIIQAGCVVVGIAESFAVEEIATRLQIAKVKVVLAKDGYRRADKTIALYEKVVAARAAKIIVMSEHLPNLRDGDWYWHDFMSIPTHKFMTISREPHDYTTILFSSGTTGEPKAIPWSHTTPIKCASDAYYHHDIKSTDILAWPSSLGWMMGPWLIYASLLNKATLAIYDGLPTTRDFGEFIQDAKVTVLGIVPSLVKSWRSSRCMEGLNWQKIKCFSSTGECSNASDMQYLMQLANNKPVIEYCGGTEIGGAYITGTLLQPAIPATFTTPALGMDFILFDEQGKPAHKGEVGIIGPSIGLSTELLNRNHAEVYFAGMPMLGNGKRLRRHGDELEQLNNGYYHALGRADDTMNLSGIKISSIEIERVLNNISGIKETAAIAVKPTEGGPDQLVIYTVLTKAGDNNRSAWHTIMQQAIKEHLNPLFKIHDIIFIAVLPRTATNKIIRRSLRNEYK